MNRFAYAEANPWTFSDPSGNATCFASSDLCDETMAIRHQGTAAGRDAVRRSGSRTKVNHWYNRALHAKAPARIYETNPKATPETASTDEGWGEAASIGRASATETAAQAAAVKCTQTRLGASCQTAQQQADAAATNRSTLAAVQHDAHRGDRAPVRQHLRVRSDDARVLRVRQQLVDEGAVTELALRDRVPDADDAVATDVVHRYLDEGSEQGDDGLAHGQVRLEPLGGGALDRHVRTICPLRTISQASGCSCAFCSLECCEQPLP